MKRRLIKKIVTNIYVVEYGDGKEEAVEETTTTEYQGRKQKEEEFGFRG